MEDEIETLELLCERETYWINFFNSTDKSIGYNIMSSGWQYERDESTLKKLSESLKNFYTNPDHRKKLSDSIKNTFSRSDMKEKIKAKNLKLWEDELYRKKVTDANLKAWSNPEKKEEHSKRLKEAYSDPKSIQNLKASAAKMKILECPHCKKTCKSNHAKGSHFDNCVHHTDPEKRASALKRRKERNSKLPKIECPHCGKTGLGSNIRRWHMDNCKHRELS